MTPTCTQLWIYPLKSAAPIALERATVELRGLAHDRRWLVIDAAGCALTARDLPRLVLLGARATDAGLELAAPAGARMPEPRRFVPLPDPEGPRVEVELWTTRIEAALAEPAAAAWLSAYLGVDARLVHCDARCERPILGLGGRAGDRVSFADGYPLLLLSEASLARLSERLGAVDAAAADVRRFRPNVVVAGVEAHAEDDWTRLEIGGVPFDVAKACPRCVLTTVDPDRGERDARGQPLRELATYRNTEKGVLYGMNLIPRGTGEIRVGERLRVLA
jgi:uncharacterized protein YcbX